MDVGNILPFNNRLISRMIMISSGFKNRMAAESIPQHIYQMEAILDTAQ